MTAKSVRGNLPFVATYQSVLDALGDATRREIVAVLRRGPASVAELADHLPVTRPAVSQHLRVLREAGLVAYDEQGTRNVYRLEPGGLAALRAWVDGFWDDALASFEDYAHRTHREDRR